ncbi:major facilitator superfamily domain-containing protein [Lipomyces oligophaga]|uniref:major facilitator superfamily domain-containing protein n=1 Tax=Lipomyces oligophaga TaxID=45792 RepID=UPI0034CDF95A
MSDELEVEEMLIEETGMIIDQNSDDQKNIPSNSGSSRNSGSSDLTDTSTPFSDEFGHRSHDQSSSILNSMDWFKAHFSPIRNPSVYFLLPAFLLLTTERGALMAPKLNILLSLICRSSSNDIELLASVGDVDPSCQTPVVHAHLSKFNMTVGLIQGILSAIVAPKLGNLSDRLGRCPILVFSVVGPLIANVIVILISRSSGIYDYRWFWAAAIFDGITGSAAAVMATAQAYATDCTMPEDRASVFGLFHACLFLGFATGPAMGGYIIKVTGNMMSTFYFAIVMQVIFMVFVAFVLPESISAQSRESARQAHARAIQDQAEQFGSASSLHDLVHRINFIAPLKVLRPTNGVRLDIRRNLVILALIDTAMIGIRGGSATITILYSELTFGWASAETGYFISMLNTVRAVVLIGLLPVLMRYLRSRDVSSVNHVGASFSDIFLLRGAILIEIIASIMLLLSQTGDQFAISGALNAAGSIAPATIESALTKHVAMQDTGALQGALSLMHSLCSILAPTMFATIYTFSVAWFPGLFFVALISISSFMFMLSLVLKTNKFPSLYTRDVLASEEDLEIDRPHQQYHD